MKIASQQKSIKTKILGIVLGSIFAATVILGYLSFSFSASRLVTMTSHSLLGIAATAANSVDAQDILFILKYMKGIQKLYMAARSYGFEDVQVKAGEAGEEGDPLLHKAVLDYKKYMDLLAKIKLLNQIDTPINVYATDGNNLTLAVTSDDVLLTGVRYQMRPEMREVFSTGQPKATGIYKDKDGTWISVYAPISYLDEKDVRAILEINYKIDSYIHALNRELAIIFVVCFIVFSATSLIGYHFVNRLVVAIKKLELTAAALEQENYSIPIDIRSNDEIGHLAITFEKLRLSIKKKIEELRLSLLREKKSHLESIIALTNAIELRDPYTRNHLYRVEKYALLIAKTMRLPRSEIETLRYGCYLHDIGKIGIESTLLQKVKLTSDDFEEVKTHTEKGARIVEGIHFLAEVKDIILHHQERYDGKGYPDGLAGDAIPLLARIVAVADSFDAMTTDRPYKARKGFQEAMDEVKANSGTQFDPEVCQVFLRHRDTIEKIAKKHFDVMGKKL